MLTNLPTRAPRLGAWPWREVDGLENRLRTLFDVPFAEPEVMGWVPMVDVVETDAEMVLTAELPGLTLEDVEIELEGNVLTLHGEKTREIQKEEAKGERKMRLWERRYGEFSRSFTLPNTVEAKEIRAEFDHGVLTIHMPKTLEAKGRRIAIKAK